VVYDLADMSRLRGAILFLHDLDSITLEANSAFTDLLDEHRLACACPRADGSWWLDRLWPSFDQHITPERWVVEQVMPFIERRWRLSPGRLGLTGLGMGGQGALRLAFRHSESFQVVAGMNAILDFQELYHEGTALDEMYDSKEQCRQDTAILQIHPAQYPAHMLLCCDPANQRWLRGNDRLHEKLSALGIAHELDFATTVGGANWPFAERMADRVVNFLVRGIVEQSRRIL
jgi:S-formylglutathione hydrolase